jgi:[ribosomal protein S5]-alanine N-acetyltransferase
MNDLDYLVRYANNKKIADNLTDAFPHPYTHENGREFIMKANEQKPLGIFAIEVDGVPCGAIGIQPGTDIRRKSAEMGYWLAEEYWGKGIVTDAVRQMVDYGFRNFDLNRIFARPFSTNIASQRVLEKAGLAFEARLVNADFKNGRFVDEMIYVIRK